ncbi:MAG: mannose-1-phosphate guanylyltransferase/mannose-6-phosphate isomerase [Thermodesulfobacteriota bacterium]
MITPVVLAGGSGTRLWPLSRKLYPKQFLPLLSEQTMFQDTVSRLMRADFASDPVVVCNEEHRFLVAEQLREIDIIPRCIILEPEGKNTAPAVCVAAQYLQSNDQEQSMLVLPADHYLSDVESLLQSVKSGEIATDSGHLVTFGIVPQKPETGYGYIQRGSPLTIPGVESEIYAVGRFVEKPDHYTAQQYVQDGSYYWNSGMFMFNCSIYLSELQNYSPEILECSSRALEMGKRDLDFLRLDSREFTACPNDSVDYAVMEHTGLGAVLPLESGWSDVGSWDALWSIQDKDREQNVKIGDVIIQDVQNSYIHSNNRLIAAVGLQGQVVVETSDAVMICPKERVQEIKQLVDRLKQDKRQEIETHRKVYRPWGAFESISQAEQFQVKHITVKPGAQLSLQKHFHRSEHWVIVRGTALVTNGEEERMLKEDQSTYIPLGNMHKLKNPGKIPLELIEVQTGSYLGEDDIVRIEDSYGRVKNTDNR